MFKHLKWVSNPITNMQKGGKNMAKKSGLLTKLVSFVAWLTGVLVSLAVGFGMIDQVLTIRWIPAVVTIWAGWIVVILTILSIVLAVIERL